jgi:hypothetical protein
MVTESGKRFHALGMRAIDSLHKIIPKVSCFKQFYEKIFSITVRGVHPL